MSTPEPEDTPDALALASLVSSRLCHDLSGAVGAVLNGLELAVDDGDEVDREALDLVVRSADLAARRLAFSRLAFGAYGGAQAVEAVEVERLLAGFLEGGRARLDFRLAAGPLGRDEAKLLVNLVAVAAGAIPRGGVLEVTGEGAAFAVAARGETARLSDEARVVGEGIPAGEATDPRAAHAILSRLLAARLGRRLAVEVEEGAVVFRA